MAKPNRSLGLQVSLGLGTLAMVIMVGYVISHHNTITIEQEGIVLILLTVAVGLQWWASKN